jgi:hypothetical protein
MDNKIISNKLSNIDISMYALYKLGGWQKRIHAEDIALECFRLAPRKFSWIKYPQYPDISPVVFALGDAKKKKFGELVIGETERQRTIKKIGGWMLTAQGIRWIKENIFRIEQLLGENKITKGRLFKDRRVNELYKSKAFNKFLLEREKANISHAEFAESLICTVNTGIDILNARLNQFESIAEELKKVELKEYINFCRKKFALLLAKRGGKNAKD